MNQEPLPIDFIYYWFNEKFNVFKWFSIFFHSFFKWNCFTLLLNWIQHTYVYSSFLFYRPTVELQQYNNPKMFNYWMKNSSNKNLNNQYFSTLKTTAKFEKEKFFVFESLTCGTNLLNFFIPFTGSSLVAAITYKYF